MNIEESAERVKKWCEFYRLREKTNIDFLFSIAEKDIPIEAIETLLTAYEKEKEKNKELRDRVDYLAEISGLLSTDTIIDWEE